MDMDRREKKEQDKFGYGQKGEGGNRILWIGDKKGMIRNGYGQEGDKGVGQIWIWIEGRRGLQDIMDRR